MKRTSPDDTIAAISTPPGEGGIGIVRLSGPDSVEMVQRVFAPSGNRSLAKGRVFHGEIRDGGVVVDRELRTSHSNVYALGDCAEVDGLNLLYVMPLMACARALAKTLAGNPTAVAYGPMPVTVKTPVCPLVVSPPPRGLEGNWTVEGSGSDIKALCRDATGRLLGYALTGAAVQEKLALNRELPPLLA